MTRVLYYALFILASTPFCQGTTTVNSRAKNIGFATLKAAFSGGSFYCAYKIVQQGRVKRMNDLFERGISPCALEGLYGTDQKKRKHALDALAYLSLIGSTLYVACRSGLSAYKSFKEAYPEAYAINKPEEAHPSTHPTNTESKGEETV
ncbi:hypothetical protein H0X06_03825 [Candidatus Dependentiae bacterium]|nr:hypothetical protein [Candidatus Dependentiae bacterium]